MPYCPANGMARRVHVTCLHKMTIAIARRECGQYSGESHVETRRDLPFSAVISHNATFSRLEEWVIALAEEARAFPGRYGR